MCGSPGSPALHPPPRAYLQVPGEDPELTGNYAANFVQGLQGSPTEEYPDGVDPTGKISRRAVQPLARHPVYLLCDSL